MSDYGIKVTKEGKSTSSADPRDYVVWSKYPTHRVAKEGSGMATIAGGTSTKDLLIDHSLGYCPQILVYASDELDAPVDSGKRYYTTDNSANYETSFVYVATYDNYTSDGTVLWRNRYWDIKFVRWNVAFEDPAYYFYKYYILYDETVA